MMGIRVDGHGPSGETIVAWKAIRKGQETRYDVQLGKKAGTMTIDINGNKANIRENTFHGNDELHRVMVFLNADLYQQVTPSGTPGASSLSTQSLGPQDWSDTDQGTPPNLSLVSSACGGRIDGLYTSCANAPKWLDAEERMASEQCGFNNCPEGDLEFTDEAVDVFTDDGCNACEIHLRNKRDLTNMVAQCKAAACSLVEPPSTVKVPVP
jgi:hypothetical protein